MVFFQLNVTGLLFQSFRTASPKKLLPRTPTACEGGENKCPQMIGLTPYPMLCRPFRAILRYAALPGLTERIKRQSLFRAMRQWLPLRL